MILTYVKHNNSILDILNKTDSTETVCLIKDNLLSNIPESNISFIKSNINTLKQFNKDNFNDQYTKYTIPKRKGGVRHIVDPSDELKELQKRFVQLLKHDLKLKEHNCAQAYINHKDCLTNAKQHINAKVVLSLDIHDFFGSISKECLVKNLNKLVNYFQINYLETELELDKLLNICLLDNYLPQGSPASPYLSNLVMIEFDERMNRFAKSKNLVYTRYADDMYFSGETIDHPIQIQTLVQDYLNRYVSSEIKLNHEKTKITRPGKCYITGIKLNKNNELTYGHEQKTNLKHKLYNLFISEQNGTITKEETQEVLGLFSYAHRIEPNYFNYIERKYLKQFRSKETKLSQHFKQYL